MKFWIAKFFNLQIFITLIALPIQLWWGLPLSIVSPLSNLFFLPFLTIFLFFSSLLFFCSILGIPHGILIKIVEFITICWQKIMSWGSIHWLVGCPKPPIVLLIAILIISFLILHHKKIGNYFLNGFCLLVLLSITIFSLKYFQSNNLRLLDLPCNNGTVKIIAHKELIVIDPGYIGSKISAEKWISYNLIPTLIQNYGRSTIDHLILMQPSVITFNAFAKASALSIKNLYVVTWNGTLKSLNYSYMQLCSTIKKQNGSIIRIGKQTRTSVTDQVAVELVSKELSYKEVTYPALKIILPDKNGIIDQFLPKSLK